MKSLELIPSVEFHTELNPILWRPDQQLNSEVRGALIRMAEDFIKFVGIDFPILDIVFAGGNANYNYSSKSDIDLHIITDYSKIQCDRIVGELFDSKRLLYNKRFDLKIHKIPVELYVEDVSVPAVSASYSITKDKWLKKPSKNIPEFNQDELNGLITTWSNIVNGAIKIKDLTTLRRIKLLLKKYRQYGLKTTAGEFSIPNLVYKTLRNSNEINKLINTIDDLHDQTLNLR